MRAYLKKKMKEMKVKPQDLADLIEVEKSFIYKIIADVRTPTLDDAKKIADFLEDTIENLFFIRALDDSSKEQSTTKESA